MDLILRKAEMFTPIQQFLVLDFTLLVDRFGL